MVAAGMTTTTHARPTAFAQSSDAAPEPGQALSGILRTEEGHTLAHTEVLACSSTGTLLRGERIEWTFSIRSSSQPSVRRRHQDRRGGVDVAAPRSPRWCRSGCLGRAALDVGPGGRDRACRNSPRFCPGQDPQTLRPGDGLELTCPPRMDLQVTPGKVLLGVAARRIPLDQAPAYRLPAHETVVAVFAVYPLGATSRSPIPVRAPSTLPPKGTPVRFRSVDDIDGTLSTPVPGRATGTHVVTDGSAGITRLTHVAMTAVSQ